VTESYYAGTSPVFRVEDELKGELARDLLWLEVEEGTEGLRSLSARFLAIGPAQGAEQEQLQYLDGRVLDFGKRLRVSLGPPEAERVVFTGTVSALEADFREAEAPVVRVMAEDALMKLRMTHRMKAYENVTDADIAQAVASEHGLQADAAADGPTYDVVHQWNQSDLAFLRQRARLVQAEIWVADDTLNFKTRPNRRGTEVTLVQGNHLLAVQLRADLAHQRSTVKVSGYDAQQRAVIEEEAGADAVEAEISGGRTGVALVSQALGERVTYRVREAPLNSGEASSWARAEMLRRGRRFVTVAGTTRGTPDLEVGSQLTLQRVGAPFEGAGYYVTRIRHTYDLTNGLRTHFDAERATVNEAV
jgi:phage protein D